MEITKTWMKITVTMLCVFVLTAGAQKDPSGQKRGQLIIPQKAISLEIARQMIMAAEKVACTPTDCRGAFAVVDEGGYVIALEKLDGSELPSSQLAIGKARTAALYQRSTTDFRTSFDKGINYYMTFPDLNAARGGVPLIVDGKVIGGFGEAGNMTGPGRPAVDAITGAAVAVLAKATAQ